MENESKRIDPGFLRYAVMSRPDLIDAARALESDARSLDRSFADPGSVDGLGRILSERCDALFMNWESHYGDRHMDRSDIPEPRREFVATACMNALVFDAMMGALRGVLERTAIVVDGGAALRLRSLSLKSAFEWGKATRVAMLSFERQSDRRMLAIARIWYDLPDGVCKGDAAGMLRQEVQIGAGSWMQDELRRKPEFPTCELRDVAKALKAALDAGRENGGRP